MLDILRFIFSSFWVWSGTVILIFVVTTPLALIFGEAIGTAVGVALKSYRPKRLKSDEEK